MRARFDTSPSTLEWLLQPTNPVIEYFTLRQFQHARDDDSEVVSARERIPESVWVKTVFRGMQESSYWEYPKSCYFPKYSGTVWRLQLLAQLGMHPDHRIRKACERFLTQHLHSDGGFTCGVSRSRFSEECITGRMVATLARFGYEKDPRLDGAIEWLVDHQLGDGGWNCHLHARPRVAHSSIYSTQMALWGFSELGEGLRARYRGVIKSGIEFMLHHRLFKSHRTGEIIKKSWLQLKFPGNVGYDILHALMVLMRLGVRRDERLRDALEVLLSKKRKDGRWILDLVPRHWGEGGFSDYYIRLEPDGRPSKWITLNALTVLDHFY